MTAADIARLDVPAAELAVQLWNERNPVGAPVIAYPGCRPEDDPSDERIVTTTRSKATVLGGHTAVVWVNGHGACIALTHVDPDHAVAEDVLLAAMARTHSPSDRIAYALDLALLAHPERCSTAADYPDWTPGRVA